MERNNNHELLNRIHKGLGSQNEESSATQELSKLLNQELTKALGNRIETADEFPCYILQLRSYAIAPYIGELAKSFREMFNNAFGQFIFYPSDGEAISYDRALELQQKNTPQKSFVSIQEMDSFDLDELRSPLTGEVPMFWHHPQVTEKILYKKLCESDGYASFLMSKENDQLLGAIFARVCSVKEEFESEEWQNPFLYSGLEDKSKFRKLDDLLDVLNVALEENPQLKSYLKDTNEEFTGETKVFGWNNMYIHPSIRKSGQMLQMTKAFFDMVGDLKNEILILGETMYGSHAYGIFTNSGLIDVHGFLNSNQISDGDIILKVGPLGPIADAFSMSSKEFRNLGKKTGAFGS